MRRPHRTAQPASISPTNFQPFGPCNSVEMSPAHATGAATTRIALPRGKLTATSSTDPDSPWGAIALGSAMDLSLRSDRNACRHPSPHGLLLGLNTIDVAS